jgi:hydrogenase nickel incorporation protein HypB
VVIEVLQDLLSANNQVAAHNREHFDEHGVLAINLMSSPGAGKTALLEATIVALRDRYRIAVIEGDLETDNDAARIRAHGVPAIQITTGTACHLDAGLVHRALHDLPLPVLICCSSKTSATWCARRASISGNTATSRCSASPRAMTSRRNIR